ncbi:MAG: MFS transporter [Deltaproteobacteria bacterium]|nr:MFS transporter [Deltaproteobacteria bacterium]
MSRRETSTHREQVDIFSGFLVPLLPLLIAKHRLSLTAAGALTLVQRVPSLFDPLIGVAVDGRRLKPLVVWAPMLTAITMSTMGLADDVFSLGGLLLLSGVGVALFHTPAPVLVAASSGTRVGWGMSLFMLGGEAARTLAPMVALAAVSWWRLEGLAWLLPLAPLAAGFLQWRLREPPPRPVHGGGEERGKERKALRRVLVAASGIIAARSFVAAAITTYLPSYLRGRGRSLWFAGVALSVVQGAGALGTFAAGTLSDRFGRRWVLGLILLASPLLMAAFILTHGSLLLAVLAPLGLVSFAANPVLMAAVQDVGGSLPATANGLYMTLNFLLRAVIIVAVGALGDAFGLERAFWLSAGLSLLGLPFVALMPVGRRSDY